MSFPPGLSFVFVLPLSHLNSGRELPVELGEGYRVIIIQIIKAIDSFESLRSTKHLKLNIHHTESSQQPFVVGIISYPIFQMMKLKLSKGNLPQITQKFYKFYLTHT